MRDLMTELKELRVHGMAGAWEELVSQGTASTASSKWLLKHMLQQERADSAVRSVNHQMNMAKPPMHLDFAGFDFSASKLPALIPGWSAIYPVWRSLKTRRKSCSLAA